MNVKQILVQEISVVSIQPGTSCVDVQSASQRVVKMDNVSVSDQTKYIVQNGNHFFKIDLEFLSVEILNFETI